MTFENRTDAGNRLGDEILHRALIAPGEAVLVLAIPRGGVAVAREIAQKLHAPLDLWLARKIGAPGNTEFAVGSVSVNGETYLNEAVILAYGISPEFLREEIARQRDELARRMLLFRGNVEPLNVRGKTVILVDDGVATGATAFSALASLKRAGAARRILAVPVAPFETAPQLRAAADETVLLETPRGFSAVGQFYRDFEQVSDQEVTRILGSQSEKNVL